MIITGEIVKNAVAHRLSEMTEGLVSVYKEAITSPNFPNYFVYLLNVVEKAERKNRYFLTYYFDVRYRVASDSSTDLTLQKDLDAVGILLFENFEYVQIAEEKMWIANKSIEKQDGVLHFFFQINLLVKKEIVDVSEKQMALGINIKLQSKKTED